MRSIIGKRSVSRMVSGGLFAALFAFGSASALAAFTVTKKGGLDATGHPTFTIVLSNPAPGPVEGDSPQVIDPLPGIDTINWQLTKDTDGGCGGAILTGADFPPGTYPPTQQVLECDGASVFEGDEWTIVVTGADPITGCLSIANTVYVNTGNYGPMTANGSLSAGCGRMTGGGSVSANSPQTRVTHGFELHCDVNDPRQNLEINWAGGGKSQSNFHLTSLVSANCYMDDAILTGPQPPNAGFNTFVGTGKGTCNGAKDVDITFKFVDAGEPGSKDFATYDIGVPCPLSAGPTALIKGNQQAHQ